MGDQLVRGDITKLSTIQWLHAAYPLKVASAVIVIMLVLVALNSE